MPKLTGAPPPGLGPAQELVYRETDAALLPYDGHHVQIYVADFSGPHRRLRERGLISEESDRHHSSMRCAACRIRSSAGR
jgi:hypothetical protein